MIAAMYSIKKKSASNANRRLSFCVINGGNKFNRSPLDLFKQWHIFSDQYDGRTVRLEHEVFFVSKDLPEDLDMILTEGD